MTKTTFTFAHRKETLPYGGVAERLIAPVLKTGIRDERIGGSNPSSSAPFTKEPLMSLHQGFCFLGYFGEVNPNQSLALTFFTLSAGTLSIK
jgi:hypothetical protein